MKTDISLDALSVIMESANFNLDIGDNAKIDIGQAVDYIKSGEAEIEAAVQTKTAAFNLNAQSQITEFNTNALLQTQNFDNHIEESLNLAKQWAIGLPNEPEGNSAKYWAEQSALNLNNKQDKIPAGNAGEVVIYSGIDGIVGSATMPIVNDATLTIQKNSATVGKFTANAVDDKIINISVPTQASDIGAQEILVSGINIKTINSNSLLESGDVKSHEIITSTITNCITEIPQDIKLELIDGVLTLKAGSKVYVPNGAGKFDVVNITTDRTPASNTLTGKYFVFVSSSNLLVDAINIQSGSSFPSSATSGNKFYNTTENKFYRYSGSEWQPNLYSLPLAIITLSSGSVTSIDQVFNGFGYIGSTVFALPNVKGLIPNGRNTDGSLRNIEFETSSVLTLTGNSYLKGIGIYINATDLQFYGRPYFVANEFSDIPNNFSGISYIISENMLYTFSNGIKQNKQTYCVAGVYDWTDSVITSFSPKTTFHAVDRNDSSWVSAQAMPSGKYIDLTLGASGSTYTAPANGWLCFGKQASATNQRIALFNAGSQSDTMIGSSIFSSSNTQGLHIFVPAKKGDKITVTYNAAGTNIYFRFIYAEGEE